MTVFFFYERVLTHILTPCLQLIGLHHRVFSHNALHPSLTSCQEVPSDSCDRPCMCRLSICHLHNSKSH